ncbi:flagellar basal body-associated FliL family protein [Pedomonas mirosovicensis]|uniref:flagellar basal body-associated FliL family protein n=1 Tax=Pedomonas mirosovicensis TaxID=2908641 RepID=UPI00216A4377|nr:flagellar basal body-associated FliL family protein [Pedomonas mirosovicensis]MCH8685454.1 flagellar basal body-associated FliL family protein [Pedomonas mirosovicensis]
MAEKAKNKAEADGAAAPKKPSKLVPMLMALVGILVGGGGAAAYFLLLAPQHDGAAAEEAQAPAEPEGPPALPEFVDLSRMTVPLVTSDGKLSGYMNLDLKFEVKAEDAEFVKARIPMVRHAINETLSHTPIADARNPQLLDYDVAEKVLRDAVNQVLGKPVIHSVRVTSALPI